VTHVLGDSEMRKVVTIRLCRARSRKGSPCKWEDLSETGGENVRYCGECNRRVYLCHSDQDTVLRALGGECVAREGPDSIELPKAYLDEPPKGYSVSSQQATAVEWMHRERGIADAIERIDSAHQPCPKCGYPVPEFRKSCYVCRYALKRG
jgi:hypothetical protein